MRFALLFLPVHPRAFSSNDGDMVMKQGEESAANGKPLNRDQGRTGFLSLKNDAFSHTTGREVLNFESSKAYACRSRGPVAAENFDPTSVDAAPENSLCQGGQVSEAAAQRR